MDHITIIPQTQIKTMKVPHMPCEIVVHMVECMEAVKAVVVVVMDMEVERLTTTERIITPMTMTPSIKVVVVEVPPHLNTSPRMVTERIMRRTFTERQYTRTRTTMTRTKMAERME